MGVTFRCLGGKHFPPFALASSASAALVRASGPPSNSAPRISPCPPCPPCPPWHLSPFPQQKAPPSSRAFRIPPPLLGRGAGGEGPLPFALACLASAAFNRASGPPSSRALRIPPLSLGEGPGVRAHRVHPGTLAPFHLPPTKSPAFQQGSSHSSPLLERGAGGEGPPPFALACSASAAFNRASGPRSPVL